MKWLFIFSLVSSYAFADCMDYRAALIAPCPEGQERFYVKGSCKKKFEYVDAFCADKDRPSCSDQAAISVAPCSETGAPPKFFKGRCKGKLKFEHMYCDVL